MNLLIILAGAALILSSFAAKKKPALKPLVPVLAVLLLLMAGVRIFSTFHTSENYTPGPEAALGQVLGERIATEYAGGTVLVVQERPVGPKAEKTADAQIRGLGAAFSGTGLEVVTVYFEPDEEGLEEPGRGFPVSRFQTWLAEYPDVVAAVSFSGFPERAGASECRGWPPFYVFASGAVHGLTPMVRKGLIKSLVVYRSGINPTQQVPDGASPRELFDMRYEFAAGG